MHFSIIKKIAIVLFLTAFPISASAAELGLASVTSALGEPLNASIELLSMTPAETVSLQAKIDSEAVYLEQGLTRLAVHDEIQLRLIKQAGNHILKLTSNSPIADPFLDLLVVVEWRNGRISRQYTLLLDPPSYQPNTNQAQAITSNQLDSTSLSNAMPALIQPSTTATTVQAEASSAQEHLTKTGDTLYKIARRMQPAGVDLDKVLVALFEANPEAFDGKNMNRLKVGKILLAPSADTLNAMTNQYANDEIKLQTADWNQYRHQLAEAIAQKAAQAIAEDRQSSSGKINSAAEDKSISTDTAKDVVKLSTAVPTEENANIQAKLTALEEEISAREKALKEAEDRTAALEKQIEDMQKLLVLKNNAMLNAQKQSTQSQVVQETESKSAETNQSALNAKPDMQESVKSQETVEQPSLIDATLNKLSNINKKILLAIAGILVLLMAVWLFLGSQRSKQLNDLEQGIMTSASLEASAVSGESASGNVATGDAAFSPDFSDSASGGLTDANDVDPIAEAEVYIAYGRDAQAEETLKEAILKEPERYALHHKLLEMYASNQNAEAFETVAGEMLTALGADNPIWIKVAEMGSKLEPANPLYQLNETVNPKPADQNLVEVSAFEQSPFDETMREPDFVATQSTSPEIAKFESVKSQSVMNEAADDELDVSDFSDSPLAAEVDLDFSISDNDEDKPLVAGFDNFPTEISLQRAEMATSDIPFEVPSELTLDMPITNDIETNHTPSGNVEESSLKDLDVGIEKESNDIVLDAKNANALDVSSISLEMSDVVSLVTDHEAEPDADEAQAVEEQMTPAYEEVETKLELVAAYIDMEDKDGAKELLDEVLKDGNASQRERANQILVSLA